MCVTRFFAVLAGLAGLTAGCGDALLPSDFSGPPASSVDGTVMGQPNVSKDADRPALSLQWLSGLGTGTAPAGLVDQPLTFRRSQKLESDWEIGLQLPAETATFEATTGGRRVRLGIAKMVYFDDREANGHLDWTCAADRCDEVKGISAEFVVFVQGASTCGPRTEGAGRPRLGPGYHYFQFPDGRAVATSKANVSFQVTGYGSTQADLKIDLEGFARTLLRSWVLPAPDGC